MNHTYVHKNGDVSYFSVASGKMNTVKEGRNEKLLNEYRANLTQRLEIIKKSGNLINNVGDGIAAIGYVAPPFSQGASLTIYRVCEGVSLGCQSIVNAINFEESGLTKDNITNLSIGVLIEILPLPIEHDVIKSNLDDIAKKIIRSKICKIKQVFEFEIK